MKAQRAAALTIKAKKNRLVVKQGVIVQARLYPENDSVFFEDPHAAESFEFRQSPQGDYVLMGWNGVKLTGIKE